jgi:MerR family Zn(II)-responsive transcriptional regulator of zntA
MFTIGKLAALTEVSTDTLRYYERERLIAPVARSGNGYRLYDREAIRRLRFIKQAQRCGFTLAEIRELLALQRRDARCGDVRRRAVEKRRLLETKIRAMTAMSQALDRLIADCTHESYPVDACPILRALDQVNAATPSIDVEVT